MTKKFIIVVSVPESENGRAEWAERVLSIIADATIFLRACAHECGSAGSDITGPHVADLIPISRGNLIAKMQQFAFGYAANGFGLLMLPRLLVRDVLCVEDADCLAVPCGVDNRPQSARPIRSHEDLMKLIGEPLVTGQELLAQRPASNAPTIANPNTPTHCVARPVLSAARVGIRSGVAVRTLGKNTLAEMRG